MRFQTLAFDVWLGLAVGALLWAKVILWRTSRAFLALRRAPVPLIAEISPVPAAVPNAAESSRSARAS